jgi:hypothetical protein
VIVSALVVYGPIPFGLSFLIPEYDQRAYCAYHPSSDLNPVTPPHHATCTARLFPQKQHKATTHAEIVATLNKLARTEEIKSGGKIKLLSGERMYFSTSVQNRCVSRFQR